MSLRSSLGFAAFVELCDGLPGVIACAKDLDLVYVYANDRFAERCGQRSVADVVGRRSTDFFPDPVAAEVERQDRDVLATGHPLQDHLEVVFHNDGSPHWWATSKVRYLAEDGSPLGLLVASVEVAPSPNEGDDAHAGLARAVAHIRANLARTHRIEELAAIAGLTAAQLDRLTRRVFGLAPTRLVQRVRLEEAMHRLSHTRQPIAEVAAATGFYDQPTFTRQFRAATGLTPGAYRTGYPALRR